MTMFQHICKDQKATSPRPLCMEETAATLGPRNWACHTKSWLCLADACPELKDLRRSIVLTGLEIDFLRKGPHLEITWTEVL